LSCAGNGVCSFAMFILIRKKRIYIENLDNI
jgi:hypothetical protein